MQISEHSNQEYEYLLNKLDAIDESIDEIIDERRKRIKQQIKQQLKPDDKIRLQVQYVDQYLKKTENLRKELENIAELGRAGSLKPETIAMLQKQYPDLELKAASTSFKLDNKRRMITRDGDLELKAASTSFKPLRKKIFISYSHKDIKWKDRLVRHFGENYDQFDLWDDSRIEAGDDWYQEIQKIIVSNSLAILIISADFFTSKFICNKEVPQLLERRKKEGLRIFPILIMPCRWQKYEWLSSMEARPKDGRFIAGGNKVRIEKDLMEIADEIEDIIKRISGITDVQ